MARRMSPAAKAKLASIKAAKAAATKIRVTLFDPGLVTREETLEDLTTDVLAWLRQNGGSYTAAIVTRVRGKAVGHERTYFVRPLCGLWESAETWYDPKAAPKPGDAVQYRGGTVAGRIRRVIDRHRDTGSYIAVVEGLSLRIFVSPGPEAGTWFHEGRYSRNTY